MQVAEQPSLVTDRERELGAIISAYNDVTERLKSAHERLSEEVVRLREELRLKNVELRRKERLAALGEMAAGLAHEIRNPLGGIALYASMLEGQLAEHNRSQTAARKISQGVRELDRLVVEILDFAQEQRLDIHACKLGSVLSQVEDATRPWAQTYGAKVAIDLEAGDVDVFCDPARLGQVLLNLLLNGVQAAGQDGCVRLSAAKGQNGGTRIEVSDNGPGIPAEHLDKMFNPFFTTRESGTGLGLAIAHRIVEAHEGTIKASNRTKGGARFVVELPPLKD